MFIPYAGIIRLHLTHWGRRWHIYELISDVIIGLDNALLLVQHQAIILTIAV